MNSSSNVNEVKIWVFEHVCKHGMETALRLLVGDENFHFLDTISTYESNLPMDPSFMFLLLLKKLKNTLKFGMFARFTSSMASILSLAIDLLNTSYSQVQYVSFTCYLHLITRLKVLDLLNLVITEAPNSVVSEVLNMWFPRWSPSYQASVQSQFKIMDQKSLDKLETVHCDCRKFILRLTISKASRDKYLATNYTNDLRKHVSDAVICLKRVIAAIQKILPPTRIETIIEAVNDSNFPNCRDPTIQLISEYVQAPRDEGQIVSLLQALDTSVELRLSDNLGTLSDIGSDLGVDNNNASDEESAMNDFLDREGVLLSTYSARPKAFDELEMPLPPLCQSDVVTDSNEEDNDEEV